jgi:hypothetical protein
MYNFFHTNCFAVFYWTIAATASLFFSYFAPQIHSLKSWKEMSSALCISQFILNFLGSIIGWTALAYFVFWRLSPGFNLQWQDFAVLLVAFYGISGYLPYIFLQKGLPFRQ